MLYSVEEQPTIVFGTIVAVISIVSIITGWVLAFIIFMRKSDNMATLLVSATFIVWNNDASSFWEWLVTLIWTTNLDQVIRSHIEQILWSPFLGITQITVMAVFLTFPSGRWMSSFARKIFIRITSAIVIIWAVEVILFVTGLYDQYNVVYKTFPIIIWNVPTLFSATMFLWRFQKTQDAAQRQQIKWIVIFLILLALFNLIAIAVNFIPTLANAYQNRDNYFSFLASLRAFMKLGLYIAFSFSIFRYRLWDIEFFINKALVYSVLTGLLGVVGILSAAVLDYLIKNLFGEEKSIWSVIATALPLAAAFHPMRERSQKWVDKYFKPEEVNFENHLLEFRADIRNILGTSRTIEIVCKQVKKQLNVEFARIYLADENGKIIQFQLSEEAQKKLSDGELMNVEDKADYSLLIPLVVTRPVFPDLVGVIVLGKRLSGKGYSTPMLAGLKVLGKNAGEAIYLSQLNEQSKIKVMA